MPLLGRGGGLDRAPGALCVRWATCEEHVVEPVDVEVNFSETAVRVVSTGGGRSSTFFSVLGGLLNESLTPLSETLLCATLSLRLWIRSLEAADVSFLTSWASLFFTSIPEDLLDWSSALMCIPMVAFVDRIFTLEEGSCNYLALVRITGWQAIICKNVFTLYTPKAGEPNLLQYDFCKDSAGSSLL